MAAAMPLAERSSITAANPPPDCAVIVSRCVIVR